MSRCPVVVAADGRDDGKSRLETSATQGAADNEDVNNQSNITRRKNKEEEKGSNRRNYYLSVAWVVRALVCVAHCAVCFVLTKEADAKGPCPCVARYYVQAECQ